jgi:hypothetical protein
VSAAVLENSMHFISDLSWRDLQRLRGVVRQVLVNNGARADQVTLAECDKYIEAVAPETREKMIRFMVDKGEKILG